MSERLVHGSRNEQRDSLPVLDSFLALDGVRVQLVREASFEVNFQADRDCLTMPLSWQDCEWAPDTDKLRRESSHFGQATFHPKGSETYCRTLNRKGDLAVIDFDPQFRRDVVERSAAHALSEIKILSHRRFEDLAGLIRNFVMTGQPTDQIYGESLVMMVLTTCLAGQAVDENRRQGLSAAQMEQVTDYIETNLSEPMGLDVLAQEAMLSPYHFARSFKVASGVSPHQYVMDRRVTRAREMLADSIASLADIAYAVGFSSQAHMTDVFRRKLGVTPGKFRAEALK